MEKELYSLTHEKNNFNIILADMLMDDILNQVGISILEEEDQLNEEMHDLLANRNLDHVLSLLRISKSDHETISNEYNEKVSNLTSYPNNVDFNEAVNVNCIAFVKHLMHYDKQKNFPNFEPNYNSDDLDFEIHLN